MSLEDMQGEPDFGKGGVETYGSGEVSDGKLVQNTEESQESLVRKLDEKQRKRVYSGLMNRLKELDDAA